jgi:ribonuclease BN (tRNA processing enzyme)
MKVRILGCSGAICGAGGGTTSLLVDDDILIDAGTGVSELSELELAHIDHVFITHSHLDHTAFLPLMVDAAVEYRTQPLTVHAPQLTLDILHAHLFNNLIWPDFTVIPSAAAPGVRFAALEIGHSTNLRGRTLTALPAQHVVPAVGYAVDSGAGSLVFSGDTTTNPAFWAIVSAMPRLRHVIVETAFPDAHHATAVAAQHYCPRLLAADLHDVWFDAELLISHLKPVHAAQIMQELDAALHRFDPHPLDAGRVFVL